jgi:endo-1,4-beta-xylanase
VITRSRGSGLVAALTFDDGPNGATTERLLDFLAARRISATFCVIGQNIRAPGGGQVLRRIASDGHLLCNHTTSFRDLGDWDAAAVEDDLVENLAIIRSALRDDSYPVPYYRAPNGNWGLSSAVAAGLGMESLAVLNTIDDWNTQDPAALAANLRAAIRPGELVLAHDGGGNREGTVDAVIAVVSERLAEGWRFTLPADAKGKGGTGAVRAN